MTAEPDSGGFEAGERPLLFISHRTADQAIADVVRKFVVERSGGRVRVFQSSSAHGDNPRIGRELQRELKERLWEAGVIVLVFTNPEEDWQYCMWECGVATSPGSPDTKVVVLQCGTQPPSVYADAVRVNAVNRTDIAKFANDFLTSRDFFPRQVEPLAPGFATNGEEVTQASDQLFSSLEAVVPRLGDQGDDWPTVPYVRLVLTYAEVDAVRALPAAPDGARFIRDAARVVEIDSEAKRLFGLGRVAALSMFRELLEAWEQAWPEEPKAWVDELTEQLRVAAHWRIPRFSWQLMRGVDAADRARYAPTVTRVSSVPRLQCHYFDVYFSVFDTNDEGAIRIGFVNERQAGPA